MVGNPSSTGKLLHFVQNSTHHHLEKKTKECYELRNEVKRLGERLQEEKNAHTTTQCRAIFAKHILNGDKDERVIEHLNKNES